ncbi:MAG: hypothetical protein ACRC5S_11655 [Cetobacterium sp.]
MNFKKSQNKNTISENLFDSYESDLVKVLLELEKELRDRVDISSIGIIFACGSFWLSKNIELRIDLFRFFSILIFLIIFHKLTVVYSIIYRIKEIKKKLNLSNKIEIWQNLMYLTALLTGFILFITLLLSLKN